MESTNFYDIFNNLRMYLSRDLGNILKSKRNRWDNNGIFETHLFFWISDPEFPYQMLIQLLGDNFLLQVTIRKHTYIDTMTYLKM